MNISMNKISILLSHESLSIIRAYDFIVNAQCGGHSLFVGTTRDHNEGRPSVYKLDFEAYEPMALKEMDQIARYCMLQFGISHMVIHHRLGSVHLKEIAVIIAASAPHRKAAFQATQYAIDQLKKTVPIWKKEYSLNGQHWVSPHP